MINSRWFTGQQNLTRPEKDELEKIIRASSIVRDILSKVVEHELEQSEMSSSKDYSLPSWPYMQADLIGYKRALKLILDMVDLSGG